MPLPSTVALWQATVHFDSSVRENFRQVLGNWKAKTSITFSCSNADIKSNLSDWSLLSYNGFCHCETNMLARLEACQSLGLRKGSSLCLARGPIKHVPSDRQVHSNGLEVNSKRNKWTRSKLKRKFPQVKELFKAAQYPPTYSTCTPKGLAWGHVHLYTWLQYINTMLYRILHCTVLC